MRAVLAPALEQFKRLVASKRSRGATDEDISQTLNELEASMREIGIMSDAQIADSMQIYHEALQEGAITHDARTQADAMLGPEIAAAANLVSATAPFPAKAARTTLLELLTIDATPLDRRLD